ncbi:MAG TPA: hypothetical protein VK778_04265 [Solirubrobacteraceae bacterium]|jgi:hypothetical protein|nr:hypothetical protein [Solirubrobacteraceae bacterium]
MASFDKSRYGILGYVAWRGAKWYVRRRLPSKRKLALTGAGALATLTAAAVLGKRLAG